jgi:hypothetical protein
VIGYVDLVTITSPSVTRPGHTRAGDQERAE